MISCDEFISNYWTQYIFIEREFVKTQEYVSVTQDNYDTYSNTYIKILLQVGSEVDVALKQYCSILVNTFAGKSIIDSLSAINKTEPSFFSTIVCCERANLDLEPWKGCNSNLISSPDWWKAYNKVKHERTGTGTIGKKIQEYYKFANLEYTILALAGLYQVLISMYYIIAKNEGEPILTPVPGSHVFILKGGDWNDVNFSKDVAFWMQDGILYEKDGMPYFG